MKQNKKTVSYVIIFLFKDGVINIKPLVNLTASLLGYSTVMQAGQQADPNDPAVVLKSMFSVWNPKVD